MKTPLVTIYVTNYNYGAYIVKAFNSILEQTYKNIEILLIDDGSTDNSREIINDLVSSNTNVTKIFQQNKGLNKTNNVAISKATGKYIMRLDADDILTTNAIELMVQALEQDESIGLVFPDYYLMDENGYKYSIHKRYNFDSDVSLFDKPAHGACTLIRLSCLKEVGGYDEDFTCQDGYELWLKFIAKFKVKNINEPLFYYRQHSSNLTKNEHKILSTRAAINKKNIEKKGTKIKSILVLPIRNDKKYFLEVHGSNFLEIKINSILETTLAQKIYITSSSVEIKNFIKEKYSANSRIIFLERPVDLERKNTSLSKTVSYVLSLVDDESVNTIQIVSPDYPLVKSYSIDDAVNTMYLYGADSILSVVEDNYMYFQHHGKGLLPIFKQNEFTKLERDVLFKSVGGIAAVRKESFLKSQQIINGKVGHLIVEEKASLQLSSSFYINLIKKML